MLPTRGYATKGPSAPLEPFTFDRCEPGPHDLLIEFPYCGICHSDFRQARDEWGGTLFPRVPGQEIVRRVTRAGSSLGCSHAILVPVPLGLSDDSMTDENRSTAFSEKADLPKSNLKHRRGFRSLQLPHRMRFLDVPRRSSFGLFPHCQLFCLFPPKS